MSMGMPRQGYSGGAIRSRGLHPLVIGLIAFPVMLVVAFFGAVEFRSRRYRSLRDEYNDAMREWFARDLGGEEGLVQPTEPVAPALLSFQALLTIAAVLSLLVVTVVVLVRARRTGVSVRSQLADGLIPPPPGGIFALLALGAGIASVVAMLDVGQLTAYEGMSQDDIDIAMERSIEDIGMSLFIPIDFVALGLLLLAWLLHSRVKRTPGAPRMVSRVGFLLALAVFVFSFFKASILVPMLTTSFGVMSAQLEAEQDLHIATLDAGALIDVQPVFYFGAGGGEQLRRATGTVTNSGLDNWESATIEVRFVDGSGAVCVAEIIEVPYVAAGVSKAFSTDRMNEPEYHAAECEPTSVTMDLRAYDIDSRSQPDLEDYVLPEASPSASVVEEEHMAGRAWLTVEGEIEPGTSPALTFEVADAQGVRLEWCFDGVPVEGAPERFETGRYHSPMPAGLYTQALAADC